MSDNPVEAAANELKKWLEQLKKIKDLLDSLEKAKIAEQKAIGDKALAAHKEMVTKTKHDELMKEFKEIKEAIKNAPDGTPGKAEALEQADELEQKMDDPDGHSLDPDQAVEGENLEVEGVDAPDGEDLDAEALDESAKNATEVAGELDEKQSTGEAIGWKKGENGWNNPDGLSVKELGLNAPKIGSAGLGA